MASLKKNDTKLEKGTETKMKESSNNRSNLVIIFRYADFVDILLMILGTIGAIGDGMSTNCLLVFASRLMNSLGYGPTQKNRGFNFMDEVEKVSVCVYIYSQHFPPLFCFPHIFLVSISFGFCQTVQFELRILGISSNGGGFYG